MHSFWAIFALVVGYFCDPNDVHEAGRRVRKIQLPGINRMKKEDLQQTLEKTNENDNMERGKGILCHPHVVRFSLFHDLYSRYKSCGKF